jgi:hypothetical protein
MLRGRTILPTMKTDLVSIKDEITLNNKDPTPLVKMGIGVILKEAIIQPTIILLLVHLINQILTKDNVHTIEKATEIILRDLTEEQMIPPHQVRIAVIRLKTQINVEIILHITEEAIPEIDEIHHPDHIHKITGINEMILIIDHILHGNKSTDQHPHHAVMPHSRMPMNL